MRCWVVYYLDPWEHFVDLHSVWDSEDEARAEVERQYEMAKQGQHPDYRPHRLEYEPAEDHRPSFRHDGMTGGT